MLAAIEPLLIDADRYKQRAGAEVLAGILRGKQILRERQTYPNSCRRFQALATTAHCHIAGLVDAAVPSPVRTDQA